MRAGALAPNLRPGVRTIPRILIVACFVACSGPPEGQAAPAHPALEPPTPHEASAHAELVVEDLDPESACGRALACCRAFVEATPHVDEASACAEPREVAELADAAERCARLTIGWRVALEDRAGVEPPAACSPPAE